MLAFLALKSEMKLLPRLALRGCYLSAYRSLCVPDKYFICHIMYKLIFIVDRYVYLPRNHTLNMIKIQTQRTTKK